MNLNKFSQLIYACFKTQDFVVFQNCDPKLENTWLELYKGNLKKSKVGSLWRADNNTPSSKSLQFFK